MKIKQKTRPPKKGRDYPWCHPCWTRFARPALYPLNAGNDRLRKAVFPKSGDAKTSFQPNGLSSLVARLWYWVLPGARYAFLGKHAASNP